MSIIADISPHLIPVCVIMKCIKFIKTIPNLCKRLIALKSHLNENMIKFIVVKCLHEKNGGCSFLCVKCIYFSDKKFNNQLENIPINNPRHMKWLEIDLMIYR